MTATWEPSGPKVTAALSPQVWLLRGALRTTWKPRPLVGDPASQQADSEQAGLTLNTPVPRGWPTPPSGSLPTGSSTGHTGSELNSHHNRPPCDRLNLPGHRAALLHVPRPYATGEPPCPPESSAGRGCALCFMVPPETKGSISDFGGPLGLLLATVHGPAQPPCHPPTALRICLECHARHQQLLLRPDGRTQPATSRPAGPHRRAQE